MPIPNSSFNTGQGVASIKIGGNPADANIAVSSSHICVTARGAFACYAKDGTLVAPGPAFQPRAYTAKEFFEQTGISTIISVSNDSNWVKDGRVVFGQHFGRFFMVFQSREALARLLIAVSKSENPQDGWWTYADPVASPGETAHDWQTIGINSANLLVSDRMVTGWVGGSPTRTRHLMYNAAELAAGQALHRGEWQHVNANGATPCVHDSFSTDAFWVNRDDDSHVSVWAVRNGNVSTHQVSIQPADNTVNGAAPPGTTAGMGYAIVGRDAQNANFRDGRIVFASTVGKRWTGQNSDNSAIQLLRLDVSHYFDPNPSINVEIDRIFGLASEGDPPGAVFDYGFPAVSTTALGDIVVGSVRSNPSTLAQFRGSVWFAAKPDIDPSVLLAASTSTADNFHMASACADRSSGGIYVAQMVGDPTEGWHIHVAEMLGGQPNWRWCNKCQGLAYAGNGPPRNCPNGGTHDHAGSGNYLLRTNGTGRSGQDNWRWCNKCEGLAFAGDGPPRKCPQGGNHDHTGSVDYELVQVAPGATVGLQDNWRWCNKCMGLAFAGNATQGDCPMGGFHNHVGSGDYGLEQIPNAS